MAREWSARDDGCPPGTSEAITEDWNAMMAVQGNGKSLQGFIPTG